MPDDIADQSAETIAPVTQAGAEPPKGGIRGFMGTTLGKVVVIGCAVSVVLAILGAIATIVLLWWGGQKVATELNQQATQQAATTSGQPGSKTASGSVEATVATNQPPAPVTNASVFLFRDPFVPVIKASITTSSTESETDASSTVETSSTADADELVLTLQDIVTDDGTAKAVLTWEGVTYTVAAGEQLGDTPWKVLSVGSSSATLLFGDVQVSLSVGEGIEQK